MVEFQPLDSRLTAATLEAFFASGGVSPIHLADAPPCTLRINPLADELELWTPVDGPEPDLMALDRVSCSRAHLEGVDWFVLVVDARGAHFEAYSLIAAIVDDLVVGRPFYAATARSLANYRELLSVRGRLTEEKTIGLIGELLMLEHLLQHVDERVAVESWVGPVGEEHDFVLAHFDAEVKSTLKERRVHLIGSENQLQPSYARPLWLVSIQLTRGGAGAEGFTVTDLVRRILDTLTTMATRVSDNLKAQGWREADAELYSERYNFRSRPRAYLVDQQFPAITRGVLEQLVRRSDLVGHVSYSVDVTDLDAGQPPAPLAAFIT